MTTTMTMTTSKCDHSWQPAPDLARGRYRCAKCKALGYKYGKMTEIRDYKTTPPEWITKQVEDLDFEPYYPRHESGRCLTMDEQEQLMGLENPEEAFEDR